MGQQIKDLVAMRDVETLYELMMGDDDWMLQLDAAEGLAQLGDMRGLEFLLTAEQSEEREIRKVAQEILETPEVAARRVELEAAEQRELEAKKQAAVKRVQAGRKVFQYKMVFLPTADILDEDPLGEGFEVPALTEYGLEGWEVVSMIARHKEILVQAMQDSMSGAYFLLKREVAGAEELS